MQLFIDTSDLEEISWAIGTGCISGVTTNPTTMARFGGENLIRYVHKINGLLSPDYAKREPVSVQVTELDAIVKNGLRLANKCGPNVVVKVPATANGLRACGELARTFRCDDYGIRNVRVNVTLVFSPAQAVIAAQAGAWCVSPFLCRWKDHVSGLSPEALDALCEFSSASAWSAREAGRGFLRSIVRAVRGTDCKVLCASVRSVEDVEDAIEAGCDIATVSPKVLEDMMQHPKTDEGLAKFMADWEGREA
jgi:transaldolase